MTFKYKLKCTMPKLVLVVLLNFVISCAGRGHGGHSSHGGHGNSGDHSSSHSSSHISSHSSSHSSVPHSGDHLSSPSHTYDSRHYGLSSPSHTSSMDSGHYWTSSYDPHNSFSNHDWSSPPSYSSSMNAPNHLTFHTSVYRPKLPNGGTYHPAGSTLPKDVIYYPQTPVSSSKKSIGLDTALGILGRASHQTISEHRHHLSSYRSEDNAFESSNGEAKEAEPKPLAEPLDQETLFKPESLGATAAVVSVAEIPVPNELPEYGVICVPMNITQPDPNDKTKITDVQKTVCYPAPPPPTTTTVKPVTISTSDPLELGREAGMQLVDSLKKQICSGSMNDLFDAICKHLTNYEF